MDDHADLRVAAPNSFARRRQVQCVLFSTFTLALLVCANLRFRYDEIVSLDIGQGLQDVAGFSKMSTDTVYQSGWPCCYDKAVGAYDGTISQTFYSGLALSANIIVGVLLSSLVAAYTWMRYTRIHYSPTPATVRRRFDRSLVAACLLVPGILVFIPYAKSRRHQKMASEIKNIGNCRLTAEIPNWLAGSFPKAFCGSWLRIREISCVQPSDRLFQRMLSLPTVRSITVFNGEIDTHDPEAFSLAPQLTGLNFIRCRLSNETLQAIGKTSIRSLSIMRCPLTTHQLRLLDDLRHLENLELLRTGLKLTSIGKPTWSSTIKSLSISRPRKGQSDQIVLDGWKNLEKLSLTRQFGRNNEAVFDVTLRNLPKLEHLILDRYQKTALTASNLPRLSRIDQFYDQLSQFDPVEPIKGLPWFDRLVLHDIPNLREVECYVADCNQLELRGLSRVSKIELGTHYYDGFSSIVIEDCPPMPVQRWIENISEIRSVESLNLTGIQLDDCDLQPLKQLTNLQTIQIGYGKLDESNLEWMTSLKSLREVSVHDCRIGKDRLSKLLKLPKLKTIYADLSDIRELDIGNLSRLRYLDTLPLQSASLLRLENLPRLHGAVRVLGPLQELVVVNTPRLEQLLIESPWPKNATMSGLDGLERFAAGGSQLGDEVIDQLRECRKLDQLTIAYPSVTPDKLKQLGQFSSLTHLDASGCEVSDAVTRHWSGLKNLRSITLNDTQVSSETFRWLSSIDTLRSLSLTRVRLNAPACRALLGLQQLDQLNLSETEFPDGGLAPLLQELLDPGNLEELTLSGNLLDRECLDAICRSSGLKRITIKDCTLSVSQLERLTLSQANRCVDIEDASQSLLKSLSDKAADRLFRRYPPPNIKTIYRIGRYGTEVVREDLGGSRR